MTTAQWIDVHAHLNMLETSVSESLRIAHEAGVKTIFTIGTTPEDLPLVLKIAQDNYPSVVCTLGIHPHDAQLFDNPSEEFIRKNALSKEVMAVGEIGLDYYYKNSEPEVQKKVFEQQLQIAADLNLPVEIHTRDAEEDTYAILKNFNGRVKGLLHCFTGTQWMADRALDLGFNISISGVVTFKNAGSLRDVVKSLPLDRIHVETDAPFLAPMPHRGKKNTPAFVVHTAEIVANLKGITTLELAKHTRQNAQKLFPKLPVS